MRLATAEKQLQEQSQIIERQAIEVRTDVVGVERPSARGHLPRRNRLPQAPKWRSSSG